MLSQEKPFVWPPDTQALRGCQLVGTSPGGMFLHGFRSHCDSEKALGLASHAAIRDRSWLRYNQRHCGQTDDEFAHFTVSQAVTDAIAVLDTLPQPVVLVGSSLGALIALQAAQQRTASIAGLLLIAPATRFIERYFLSLPDDEIADWYNAGTKPFEDEYEDCSYSLNYAFYEDATKYRHIGPWKLTCPVSILHGEKDEIIPLEDSMELEQMIESTAVTLEIIASGDHRLNGSIPIMCSKLDQLWQIN
ncbi:MAG: alpha/beta hydrolase [Arenicellales bacterium]|nr:alpha/beta hydrolase [Arenicellales bacterium]